LPELTEAGRLAMAFVLAATLAAAAVPAAIAIARRTGFLDAPSGYKAHVRPTPYLGGAAVMAAALLSTLLLREELDRYWPLLLGTAGLLVVGTIDDRLRLSPWPRLAIEAVAAWLLWREGLGWAFTGSDLADLLLTVFWIAAVVNAFNLMDNLDGAAASVAAVSAAGACALAAISGATGAALIAISLCGALIAFLRYNLARPARIFLGDGGSMPTGFLLAGVLMVIPMGELSGWSVLVAATIIVGLPIFDTALVIVSRLRRGAPVLSGATDHTTHRLCAVLGTPHAVSLILAIIQALLCLAAIQVSQLGKGAAIALGCSALLVGLGMIATAEGPRWIPASEDS
jgi:UDP-GlcNAc:undecaprenyl-phosphate GlcNAc-1-phosphate transferase